MSAQCPHITGLLQAVAPTLLSSLVLYSWTHHLTVHVYVALTGILQNITSIYW